MKSVFSLLPFFLSAVALTYGASPLCAAIPEVEVERLRKELASTALPKEERHKLTIALAEAKLEAGEALEALRTLESGAEDASFLRARILSALGRWDEALPFFRKAVKTASAEDEWRMKIAEAEALRQVGKTSEAIALMDSITDPPTLCRLMLAGLFLKAGRSDDAFKLLNAIRVEDGFEKAWFAYLRGQLALENDEPEQAADEFAAALANRSVISEEIFAGATLGLARSRARIENIAAGEMLLEDYLREYPESPYLADIFAQLDDFYVAQGVSPSNPLSRWIGESPRRRAAYAAFYLARANARSGRPQQALGALQKMFKLDFDGPIVKDALILQAQILMERGEPVGEVLNEAMRRAEDAAELGRIEMLAGAAQFKKGDYLQAAISFHNAAEHAPELRETATFNAALAWLNQGNSERFLQEYATISSEYPESDLRRELILEQGLVQARNRDDKARDTLERFLREFPDNRRGAEARVALAEIIFSDDVKNRAEAAEYLRVNNPDRGSRTSDERADYLSIYLEENADAAIELARTFLNEFPGSPLVPKVRMKLGELYYDTGDLANARTQFETLAAYDPSSPNAEAALFLAGQAAARTMNSDRALELFEEVARRNGRFALYARQEQAALKSRLGHEKEAIILYDNILSNSPPAELLYAAMIGKGDNLFLLGGKDPAKYEAAAEVFSKLAQLPEVPMPWKNQALYKQGKALEKLGRQDEALTILAGVIDSAGKGQIPDTTWIFRAGFDAAEILEARGRWQSAAVIYRSMAAMEGPRSEEARQLLTRLKLEHFLWGE